jgi:regulator of protease activity HflC (stomatin/prohibitin superfamily)
MESALAWLGQLIEWVGKLIPRLFIVKATHGGVRFKHGKNVTELVPGVHVYWPIVTEIELWPVKRQTHSTPTQSLLTKDQKQVVVSGVVIYEIGDIVAALSKNWDINDTINDIAMVAITEVVASNELAYLTEHLNESVRRQLLAVTRKKLSPFGIRVFKASLVNFSTCMTIKSFGGSMMPLAMGEEN